MSAKPYKVVPPSKFRNACPSHGNRNRQHPRGAGSLAQSPYSTFIPRAKKQGGVGTNGEGSNLCAVQTSDGWPHRVEADLARPQEKL